jgi:uncharacterized membrane protein YgcG
MWTFPRFVLILVCTFWAASVLPAPASAAEEILLFHSDLRVRQDGALDVTEEITVRAEGRSIKHGIFRDFPTKYTDYKGRKIKVGFDLLDAALNGKSVPFRQEPLPNGVRIRLGDGGKTLAPGEYTYSLRYRTTRQIGFFQNHDELYWNVTGTDWAFPIVQARARIHLPPGVDVDGLAAQPAGYTGPSGARGRDWAVAFPDPSTVLYETTSVLPPGSGLTVAVGWPKGHVTPPSDSERVVFLMHDYSGPIAAWTGLILVVFYFLTVWHRSGRDPRRGAVIPRFEPPAGLGAAACRYLRRMGYDGKTFAAALVGAAVKGWLGIECSGRTYTLKKMEHGDHKLSKGEWSVIPELFAHANTLVVDQDNHVRLKKAVSALKKALAAEYDRAYFVRNRGLLVPGILLSVLSVVAGALLGPNPKEAGFISIWLAVWSLGTIPLLVSVIRSWSALRGAAGLGSVLSAAGRTLFALPFVGGEVFGLGFFAYKAGVLTALAVALLIAVNWLFVHLIKAPTRAGRQIMDEIEGLRMYMETAEQQRLDFLHPPQKTPELFERLLPFAIALDVETRWAEAFESVLDEAAQEGGYRPGWYAGHGRRGIGVGVLASSLGSSLAGAVASSSTAPGSSSGVGGGGSSGGGGGGGGGGGW